MAASTEVISPDEKDEAENLIAGKRVEGKNL
jgi:hypothetical protein